MVKRSGLCVEGTVNETHKKESSENPLPELREMTPACPMGLSTIGMTTLSDYLCMSGTLTRLTSMKCKDHVMSMPKHSVHSCWMKD